MSTPDESGEGLEFGESDRAAGLARSEFLAVMSHEIRTPMNAILGLTQIALDAEGGAPQRELLEDVKSNAESLMAVIDDLLDFSRVESGFLTLRPEVFSVADEAESVAEEMATQAFEKGLELSVSVDPSVPGTAEGDPRRLRQVVLKLLSNAVKFTEKGQVSLDVTAGRRDGDRMLLRFSVCDTGIGVSPDGMTRVFEPFFQEDSSLARRFSGTGLGLGIARSIVERMDGRIWVESEVGVGSTFSFEVPCGVPSTGIAPPARPEPDEDKLEVWAITPNALVAEGISSAADRLGLSCHIVSVADLERSLAQATGDTRCLVLADERLGRSGLEQTIQVCERVGRDAVLQLDVLVPPGAEAAPLADGLEAPSLMTKPATRKKLEKRMAEWGSEDLSGPSTAREAADHLFAKVLVVEDNRTNLVYATHVLARAGYRVDQAMNGAEGIRLALAERYDLILTDVQMPIMDGFEMTEAILETLGSSAPPVLAFSAVATADFEKRCKAVGMVGALTKPARPSELAAAVGAAIRGARAILVVDDSPDHRGAISELLGSEFGSVEAVDNGFAAIDRVRLGGVALVVLDLNLPELDGYETARRIRSLHKEGRVPIVGVSSWVGSEAEDRCLDAGCSAFVEKPVQGSRLRDQVRRLIGDKWGTESQAVLDESLVLVDPAVADLVPEYLAERRYEVSLLRERLGEADLEAVRILAHNLAGSGAAYGFTQLTKLGRTLESVASKNGREYLTPWVDELEGYLEAVRWDVGDDLQ